MKTVPRTFTEDKRSEIILYKEEHGMVSTCKKYKMHPSVIYGWIKTRKDQQSQKPTTAKKTAILVSKPKPKPIVKSSIQGPAGFLRHTPLNLLDNAIHSLEVDLSTIRSEINRLDDLKTQEKAKTEQIEALRQARTKFEEKALTQAASS